MDSTHVRGWFNLLDVCSWFFTSPVWSANLTLHYRNTLTEYSIRCLRLAKNDAYTHTHIYLHNQIFVLLLQALQKELGKRKTGATSRSALSDKENYSVSSNSALDWQHIEPVSIFQCNAPPPEFPAFAGVYKLHLLFWKEACDMHKTWAF